MAAATIVDWTEAPVVYVTLFRNEAFIQRSISVTLTNQGEQYVDCRIPTNGGPMTKAQVKIVSGHVTTLSVHNAVWRLSEKDLLNLCPNARPIYDRLQSLMCDLVKADASKHTLETDLAQMAKLSLSLTQGGKDGLLKDVKQLPDSEEEIAKLIGKMSLIHEGVTSSFHESREILFNTDLERAKLVQEINKAQKELMNATGSYIHPFQLDDSYPNEIENRQVQAGRPLSSAFVADVMRVRLDVHTPGLVKALVTYVEPQAFWQPAYEIRMLSSDLSRAELAYVALLTQKTRDDWKDVDLSLRNGNILANAYPDKLGSLQVSFENTSGALNGGGNVRQCVRNQDHPEHSTAVFNSPEKLCVCNGTEDRKLPIADKLVLGVDTIFYAFPEASPYVFRAGRLTNDSDLVFVKSPSASIFWDGSLVASTYLNTITPGENFQVFFGVDQRCRFDAKPVHRFRKTVGMKFLTTDKESFEHSVTFSNTHDESINLMAVFRLPVSTDANIVVTIDPSIKVKVDTGDSDLSLNHHHASTAPAGQITWVHNTTTGNVLALMNLDTITKKVLLKFLYTIERPSGMAIDLSG